MRISRTGLRTLCPHVSLSGTDNAHVGSLRTASTELTLLQTGERHRISAVAFMVAGGGFISGSTCKAVWLSIAEVTLTFIISIFVLGIAAFFGGLWLNRSGPRVVAVTGGSL